MPKPRLSEMAPRFQTTRGSVSDSSTHHRQITDRSPKLGDRRSPRNTHSEPLNQKKLGTRIAGLETQLDQAQGELKLLKDQLASAEAAKKEAQKELDKKIIKLPVSVPDQDTNPVRVQDARSSPSEDQESSNEIGPDDNQKETDVFEVPNENESKSQGQRCEEEEVKVNIIAAKEEEISLLKLRMEEKGKELECFVQENDVLKRELSEANAKISSAMVNEEKLSVKLTEVEEELIKSKNDGIRLNEKLNEVEGAKEALEVEMKKLRVQTEQWRKAADAAATILAGGGVEVSEGRRVSERCGSMDKHYVGVFDGYESDDGFGNEKRKGGGMRMFGDLWKKKGHK